MSAGAMLTVMCLPGQANPEVSMAAFTRCWLSRTALSGNPTSEK